MAEANSIPKGSKRLSDIWDRSKDLVDATVRICDPETSKLIKSIPVHTLLFGMKSSVFKAMFYGDLSSDTVDIKDIDYHTFELVKEFVYLSDVTITNATEGILLHKAADKYLFEDLKKICADWLCLNVDTSNALAILNYAVFIEDEPIIDAALEVINLSDDFIIRSDGFVDVNAETVKTILFKCQLSMPEVRVLKACLGWCYHQLAGGEKSIKILKNLMQKAGIADGISFKHVSSTDFFMALAILKLPEVKACQIMQDLCLAASEKELDINSPIRFHKLRALELQPLVLPQQAPREINYPRELTTVTGNEGDFRTKITRIYGHPDKSESRVVDSIELTLHVRTREKNINLIGFISQPMKNIRFANRSNADTEYLLSVLNNASSSLHMEFHFQNPIFLKANGYYKFKVEGSSTSPVIVNHFSQSNVEGQLIGLVLIGSWISSIGLMFSAAQ